MSHEFDLKFPNERELVIETLSRLIKEALDEQNNVLVHILSVAIYHTNKPEKIRISTLYFLDSKNLKLLSDYQTVKAGEVFLNGQILTPAYFETRARVAE